METTHSDAAKPAIVFVHGAIGRRLAAERTVLRRGLHPAGQVVRMPLLGAGLVQQCASSLRPWSSPRSASSPPACGCLSSATARASSSSCTRSPSSPGAWSSRSTSSRPALAARRLGARVPPDGARGATARDARRGGGRWRRGARPLDAVAHHRLARRPSPAALAGAAGGAGAARGAPVRVAPTTRDAGSSSCS